MKPGTATRVVTATIAATALLGLSACSSSSDSDASDSGASGGGDSSAENATACTDFETAYDQFTALAKAGPAESDIETWTAAKTAEMQKFQPLADTATGEVESALTTLASALPADSLELTEPDSVSGQAFVDNSNAVADACSAAGTPVELDEFPLLTFGN
ncbi:MAG: hypothetical protein WBA00_01240 [Rhodococcus sp. (in: high G+C Gram-positive bacteria)]